MRDDFKKKAEEFSEIGQDCRVFRRVANKGCWLSMPESLAMASHLGSRGELEGVVCVCVCGLFY